MLSEQFDKNRVIPNNNNTQNVSTINTTATVVRYASNSSSVSAASLGMNHEEL